MVSSDFYNTIGETGSTLKKSRAKSRAQQILILTYMRANLNMGFTPFEIKRLIPFFQDTPITSVRRAMTNLTTDGYLVKTKNMKPGELGKMNHTWRVKLEDEVKNYPKYHNLTLEQWFDELKAYCIKQKMPFNLDTLDVEDWKCYYEDGYAPGAALLEDLQNG